MREKQRFLFRTLAWLGLSLSCLGGSAASGQEKVHSSLVFLESFYEGIDSVEFRASAFITISSWSGSDEASSRLATGSAEVYYLAEHEKFKVRSTIDPNLDMMANYEVAFDGNQTFFRDEANRILGVSLGMPSGPLPVALPNPFLLPASFLPKATEFAGCDWSLAYGDLEARWQGSGILVNREELSDGFRLVVQRDEGPIAESVAEIKEVAPGAWMPVRIESRNSKGEVQFSVRFVDFKSLGNGRWFPFKIMVEAVGEDLDLPLTLSSTIHLDYLKLGEEIPDESFRLSPKTDESLWDSDQDRFLTNG